MAKALDVAVEVEIACSQSELWSLVSDLERLPEWIGEFESARKQTDGPTGVGTIMRFTIQPGARSGTLEIVEWDPPHRWAWDGPPLRWAGGAARPRGSHEVSVTPDGRALLTSRFQPVLTGTNALLGPYLKRWLRRQRRADYEALKRRLEGGEGR